MTEIIHDYAKANNLLMPEIGRNPNIGIILDGLLQVAQNGGLDDVSLSRATLVGDPLPFQTQASNAESRIIMFTKYSEKGLDGHQVVTRSYSDGLMQKTYVVQALANNIIRDSFSELQPAGVIETEASRSKKLAVEEFDQSVRIIDTNGNTPRSEVINQLKAIRRLGKLALIEYPEKPDIFKVLGRSDDERERYKFASLIYGEIIMQKDAEEILEQLARVYTSLSADSTATGAISLDPQLRIQQELKAKTNAIEILYGIPNGGMATILTRLSNGLFETHNNESNIETKIIQTIVQSAKFDMNYPPNKRIMEVILGAYQSYQNEAVL